MDDAPMIDTAADAAKKAADTTAQAGQHAYAAGADAMKTNFDRATAAGDQAFKDASEKSLAALNELNAQSKKNFEAMIASVTAATKGAEALSTQAVTYAKSAMEGQVEHMRALSSVRSLQEAMELQTSYAKQAMEGYVAEMNKVGETLTSAVKDTFKPLNTRATQAVETIQSVR